jgi:hypothetical protein
MCVEATYEPAKLGLNQGHFSQTTDLIRGGYRRVRAFAGVGWLRYFYVEVEEPATDLLLLPLPMRDSRQREKVGLSLGIRVYSRDCRSEFHRALHCCDKTGIATKPNFLYCGDEQIHEALSLLFGNLQMPMDGDDPAESAELIGVAHRSAELLRQKCC